MRRLIQQCNNDQNLLDRQRDNLTWNSTNREKFLKYFIKTLRLFHEKGIFVKFICFEDSVA